MLKITKEKITILIYAVAILTITCNFFIHIEPIMICDPDDWTYISSVRFPIPIWKDWNPAKVLPENLMGICGFFAAYVVYPILGDYILSFTYVYALLTAVFITVYIITLLFFVKKILGICTRASLICSFVAYLLHFLFMLHRGANNLFMFSAGDLNCFVNYTIPNLFCFVLAIYFVSKYLENPCSLLIDESNSIFENTKYPIYLKSGVIILLLYLSIFSNMVCNIIIMAPFIYMFCGILFNQIKLNGIRNLFSLSNIKRYAIFVYIFMLEIICLVFEYNGGRSKSLDSGG